VAATSRCHRRLGAARRSSAPSPSAFAHGEERSRRNLSMRPVAVEGDREPRQHLVDDLVVRSSGVNDPLAIRTCEDTTVRWPGPTLRPAPQAAVDTTRSPRSTCRAAEPAIERTRRRRAGSRPNGRAGFEHLLQRGAGRLRGSASGRQKDAARDGRGAAAFSVARRRMGGPQAGRPAAAVQLRAAAAVDPAQSRPQPPRRTGPHPGAGSAGRRREVPRQSVSSATARPGRGDVSLTSRMPSCSPPPRRSPTPVCRPPARTNRQLGRRTRGGRHKAPSISEKRFSSPRRRVRAQQTAWCGPAAPVG